MTPEALIEAFNSGKKLINKHNIVYFRGCLGGILCYAVETDYRKVGQLIHSCVRNIHELATCAQDFEVYNG